MQNALEPLQIPVFADTPNGTAVGLLNTTIDVIENRGETAVRVEEVAGQLGLAVTAVYRYFGSRQGLIDAAHAERVVRSIQGQLEELERLVESSRSASGFQSAFERFVTEAMSPSQRSQIFLRVHALGSAYGRPELMSFLGEAHRYSVSRVASILGRARDQGWIAGTTDLEIVAAWFWATTFGGVVNLVDPAPIDPDAFAVIAVDALRRALFDGDRRKAAKTIRTPAPVAKRPAGRRTR